MSDAGVSLRWCWSGSGYFHGTGAMKKRFVIESSVDRRVWLHFRDQSPKAPEWRELEVPRTAVLPNGRALFELHDDGALPEAIVELAVKSAEPGPEVWDNNNAGNYRLGPADGPLLRVPIVLASWSRYRDRVSGFAYVRNLSIHKKVTVHIAADGSSFRPVEATFKPSLTTGPSSVLVFPNVHGCEAWEFSLQISQEIRELQMYLEYEVRGERHFDDNDRRLYTLALAAPPSGATQ